MREIVFGASDKLEIRGGNVAGFTFAAKVVHTTDNTAFAANPFDASNVMIKATLYRGGRSFQILADVLLPLAVDSAFYTGSFDQLLNIGTVGYQRLVAAAASTKEVVLQTIVVRFHEVINLSGDDSLLLEVQANSNAIDSNSSAANSRFLFDALEGVGNGFSIPFIRAHSIRASISSDKINLGNGLVDVKFINVDKSGITTANQVLSSVQFQSDKLKSSDSYEELLAKRAESFQSNADHALRHQSFDLVSLSKENYSGMDTRLNNCDLSFILNSGNVTASKNWVVSRGFYNDAQTLDTAKSRYNRHFDSNKRQYQG
jgi:hypothetical protein